jgi:hypothetical protein
MRIGGRTELHRPIHGFIVILELFGGKLVYEDAYFYKRDIKLKLA